MSKLVKLVQGTVEWHAHRLLHRNASETAAVMGVCPWMTAYMVWELKTGRRAITQNYAMQRGSELEPLARAAYEAQTENIVEPVVMVSGGYSASLDGLSFDGGLILEVKCPLHGRESETWKAVEGGTVPQHYRLQVQHQLMVSKASACDFWVWDGMRSGLCLRVTPNAQVQSDIRSAWDDFWTKHIVTDRPPTLTPADTVIRGDRAWAEAAKTFVDAKQAAERAAKDLETAKEALVALTSHSSERGNGVSVSRYWKGAKGTKEEVRVTVLKQDEEKQPC